MAEALQPLFDPAVLDQLTADTDVEFRGLALARFRLDLADFTERLGQASPQARLRLIHIMGSSAALMGAMRLSGLCLAMEPDALRMGAADIQQVIDIAIETEKIFSRL
jgi:hypothetical protein